jgi:hypothetical protein
MSASYFSSFLCMKLTFCIKYEMEPFLEGFATVRFKLHAISSQTRYRHINSPISDRDFVYGIDTILILQLAMYDY